MTNLIFKHDFIKPDITIPNKEISIDKKLRTEFFLDVDMEFENDEKYVVEELYDKFKSRLTGMHDKFLKILGKKKYENKILPIEYTFKEKQLDNIIGIALYYHKYLYDLWSHSYNKDISIDIKAAKEDVEKISDFIEKTNGKFTLESKHKLIIRIEPYYLEMNSFIITRSILDHLKRWKYPEKYNDQINNDRILKKSLELIDLEVEKYGDTGQGKNFETELTMKYTWLLYKFLIKENVISHPMGGNKKITKRMYYACIADIYTIVTLPDRKTKNDEVNVWDYLSEEYNKEEQIKIIESWIYNFEKKLK